jgi:tetratricopeptide (TPR) repeat protein
VTYLSQRAESLMGLCYLLTLYAFIRAAAERRTGWAWTAVAACWVGMLVKEVMVTAPVMVLLFDRLFLAGSFREAWRRRGRLHSGLFASWLALAVLMAASRIQTRGIGYGFEYSWSQYLRIETWAVLHYLGLAIWPFPLIFDYGPDLPPTPAGVAALSGVVLALLAAGIAAAWRRRPQLAFLGCWFFLILAPTSSLVPVAGQPVAENRLYLPLAAWTVFLTTTVHAMAGKRGQASLVAGAFALSALTVTRNRTCGRPLSLWGETVAKNPGNSRAHFYHADALARAGQNEAAAAHLARSLQLRPAPKTHFKLGVLQFQQGRFREAADNFGAALRALPGDAASHQNYASALVRLGREAEAVEHFRQAKQLLPESVECRVNLAITLGRLGRLPEAIREFEEVLQRDPANRQALGELAQLRALARPAR